MTVGQEERTPHQQTPAEIITDALYQAATRYEVKPESTAFQLAYAMRQVLLAANPQIDINRYNKCIM